MATKVKADPSQGPRHQQFTRELKSAKVDRNRCKQELAEAQQRADSGEVTPRFVELAEQRFQQASSTVQNLIDRWLAIPGQCSDRTLRHQRKVLRTRMNLATDEAKRLGQQKLEAEEQARRHQDEVDSLNEYLKDSRLSQSEGLKLEVEKERSERKRDDANGLAQEYKAAVEAKGRELAELDQQLASLDAEIREAN
ncbi:MAG: hypothetical protein ACE37I_10470 [Rubinisphaera brasiliensis]|uniref:hypothetical protein n=1 Tax=Rubinisphaera brasiliensis TaxID=119 RepID=UPI00391BE0FD